jgi:Rab5 GDP/GTP exchange factor
MKTIYRINHLCSFTDEVEDLIPHVRDYLERIIFVRHYLPIFECIAYNCEEKDLAIQNRISSLHWISAPMIDTVLNEDISTAADAMYKAINGL